MSPPISSTRPPISTGRKLGDKYEIKGVLGEGGTGIVYDAIRISDLAPIALKVIHAELAGDKQIRGRFTREAAILRVLDGPHVCPILEFGELPEGLLFLALPKIDGPSLEEMLRVDGPLPIARALDVMLDVCNALRAAHAHGIVHRDLKPANVILRERRDVVVVDFGMAKIVTGTGTGTTELTTHNMVFGTPEYMSPEQARGDELDARCDVYAAGIMLYELLTGSVPFVGTSPLNVLTAHLTSVPKPARERAPDREISPALEAVAMHAMAKSPDDRYETASALSAAIVHARAAPDDTASLGPKAFASNPECAEAYAPTLPAISGPTGSTHPPATRPARSEPKLVKREAASPGVKAPGEGSKTWVIGWVIAAAISIGLGVWFALRR